MAQSFDPATRALTHLYKYVASALNGAVVFDADDVRLAAELLQISEAAGDDTAVTYALLSRAITLMRSPVGDRVAGLAVLDRAREMLGREQLTTTLRRCCDIEVARERSRSGDVDGAIDMAQIILDEQFSSGEMLGRGPATTVLVDALLERGANGDEHRAQQAVDRLAAAPTEPGFVLHELPILRLRALLARAGGDDSSYREYVAQFRARALAADFAGYVAEADAMV